MDLWALLEWWTAGPLVGPRRPTARVLHGQMRNAGHETNMWRNEGEQFGREFNLTRQR
jgi:hypothetical protein